jgi:hypothetical protein
MKFVILFLLITIGVCAKNNSFSIKGGVNYSILELNTSYYNVDGNYSGENTKQQYKLGEVLYLSWEKVYGNFYLNFDLGFNKKGRTHSYSEDGNVLYSDIYYWTLEFPFIIGYRFKQFKFYGGVYFSQVFYSGNEDGYNEHFGGGDQGHLDFDLGFLIGVEYEYKVFLFNFRFQKGYTPVDRAYNSWHEVDYSYDNNTQLTFMIGFRFN